MMTDEEKRTLSERIATLAEAAGLPSELLWEMAGTCPQGHPNSFGTGIGDLCPACLSPFMGPLEDSMYAVHWEELRKHHANPSWHPEWRIGKQTKDLTTPENLLPLVKEWIRQLPDNEGWTYRIGWNEKKAVGALYKSVNGDWRHHYYTGEDATNEWVALAHALVTILEQEGERRDNS